VPTTIVMVRHGETEWPGEPVSGTLRSTPEHHRARAGARAGRRTQVEARFPNGYSRWLEYRDGWNDGESYEELGERVVSGLVEIAAQHSEELVLAVTHGGPIRSALAATSRVPFGEARRSIANLENCATVRIGVRDGIIERVN
jgi:broad specificity phosphatase PhoE